MAAGRMVHVQRSHFHGSAQLQRLHLATSRRYECTYQLSLGAVAAVCKLCALPLRACLLLCKQAGRFAAHSPHFLLRSNLLALCLRSAII
jgi:hypothetical protein